MIKLFSVNHNYKSQNYRLDVYDGDFAHLPVQDISQSYAVVYNDMQEILLVHNVSTDSWGLIGGSIEHGETLVECLERECMEEGAVTLDLSTLTPMFYQSCFKIGDHREEFESHQIRYHARVDKVHTFIQDPAGGVDAIMWARLDELSEYLKWGETTDYIVSYMGAVFQKLE